MSDDEIRAYAEHGAAQAEAMLAWTAPTPVSAADTASTYTNPGGIDPTRPAAQPRGLARLRTISESARVMLLAHVATFLMGASATALVAVIVLETTR